MKRIIFNKCRTLFCRALLFLFFTGGLNVYASFFGKENTFSTFQAISQQSKKVTGVVTDERGVPLPGVSVVVKNTTRGTSTDFDGKYEISAKQGDVLVFSFVGFKSQEKNIAQGGGVNH